LHSALRTRPNRSAELRLRHPWCRMANSSDPLCFDSMRIRKPSGIGQFCGLEIVVDTGGDVSAYAILTKNIYRFRLWSDLLLLFVRLRTRAAPTSASNNFKRSRVSIRSRISEDVFSNASMAAIPLSMVSHLSHLDFAMIERRSMSSRCYKCDFSC